MSVGVGATSTVDARWRRRRDVNEACSNVTDRAVPIELFTARVLCRVFYRVLNYSTDTGNSYEPYGGPIYMDI